MQRKTLLCSFVLFVTSVSATSKKPDKSVPPRPPYSPIPPCRDDIVSCLNAQCEVEECPNFSEATCVSDFCGGCNAIFLDKGKSIVPKFACFSERQWPECLDTNDPLCPPLGDRCETGCPGVPDAVCNQDCNCNTVFTDRRTGNVLEDDDCFPKQNQCPPLVPDNVRVSYQYKCTDGNNIGSNCKLGCARSLVLFGGVSKVVCLKSGKWSSSLQHVRCGFDNRCPPRRLPFDDSASSLTRCPTCLSQGCTRGTICCQLGCGSACTTIPRDCPNGEIKRFCDINPCDVQTCHGYPDAFCTNNYCGGCNAVFTDPANNEVIPQFACSRDMDWPNCLAARLCVSNKEECETQCPGVPTARCLQDCNCETVFTDSETGKVLTPRQCRPVTPRQCPDLRKAYPHLRFQCTRGNNIWSRCQIGCPDSHKLVGASRIYCKKDGRWSVSLQNTICVRDERCPLVKIFPIDPPTGGECPSCPFVCPTGQICCAVPGCGAKCAPAAVTPRQCPDLRKTYPHLRFQCTRGNSIGTRCQIGCPDSHKRVGAPRIYCRKDGKWTPSLENTHCVRDERCPQFRIFPQGPPTGSLCPSCPFVCPFGQICCGLPGCGARCVPVKAPPRQCPDVTNRYPQLRFSCSDGNNAESRCTVSCPAGQRLIGSSRIYCTNYGRWTPILYRTRCVRDTRCPLVKPAFNIYCRLNYYKPQCPPVCPRGQICCPSGCGSRCVQVQRPKQCLSLKILYPQLNFKCSNDNNAGSWCTASCLADQELIGISRIYCSTSGKWSQTLSATKCVLRCSSPIAQDEEVSFKLSCSDGYNVGSKCDVQCNSNENLVGITQIECLPSAQWNIELGTTQCIPRIVCDPDEPQAVCKTTPCKIAKCPGVPEAVCVDSFCGGCKSKFFVNGKLIDKIRCLPKQTCANDNSEEEASKCKDMCSIANCMSLPNAICRVDCSCVARYYNPISFEELTCDMGYPGYPYKG